MRGLINNGVVKVDVVFLEFPQEVSISVPDFIFLSPHKVRGFLCVCLCSQLSPSVAHHSLMLLVWWSSLLVEDKSLTTSVLSGRLKGVFHCQGTIY